MPSHPVETRPGGVGRTTGRNPSRCHRVPPDRTPRDCGCNDSTPGTLTVLSSELHLLPDRVLFLVFVLPCTVVFHDPCNDCPSSLWLCHLSVVRRCRTRSGRSAPLRLPSARVSDPSTGSRPALQSEGVEGSGSSVTLGFGPTKGVLCSEFGVLEVKSVYLSPLLYILSAQKKDLGRTFSDS